MKKIILIIKRHVALTVVFLLVVVCLCVFAYDAKKEKTGMASDARSATYTIEGKNVTLQNGYAEVPLAPGSASKEIVRYFGNEVRGDFNGDGYDDIVFLLTDDAGGSGTFYYAVLALGGKDGLQGENALFLGDRVAPQSSSFDGKKIVVNYADRLPNEPMTTAPSHGMSAYFEVQNNKLIQIK